MLPTILEGAETHNLKGVSLTLVPGQVVVITGVSGAGKSSLAMDTLYAEGQRRFVESFSPYARQFLERLERPPMKRLEPIPAGIAVDRRAPIKSSRSTIATMADLEPYLSALFLREAKPVCPEHGFEARELSVVSAARSAAESLGSARAVVTYPVRVTGTEAYLEVREGLLKDGYRRAWLRGKTEELDAIKPSQVLESGELEVIVDRVGSGKDENPDRTDQPRRDQPVRSRLERQEDSNRAYRIQDINRLDTDATQDKQADDATRGAKQFERVHAR